MTVSAPAATRADPSATRADPSVWRFLDGPGVVGVLKPAAEPLAPGAPIGHVAVRLADRGYFEGAYHAADQGGGLKGALWPEGGFGGATAAGFFAISPVEAGLGRGVVEMADGARFELEAR